MKKLQKRLALLLAAVTALSTTGCSNTTQADNSSEKQDGNVLSVAATRQPPSFDPQDSNTSVCEFTSYNCYDTLLKFSTDGTKLEPNLAESWEQVDDTTYTYKIRDGVKFCDGNEMTMEDVLYSVNRVMELNYGMSYLFDKVDHFEADDASHTLTVHLKEPDSTWQYVPATATFEVVEKAVVEKEGDNYGTTGGTCVGTGPYMLKSWVDNSEIVLVKNPYWWGDPDTLDIDEIDYYVMADTSTIELAVQNGTIDFAPSVSADMADTYAKVDGYTLYTTEGTTTNFLALNTEVEPFNDINARKALAYCIDSATYRSTFGGDYAKPLDVTLLPECMKYQDPDAWASLVDGLEDYTVQDFGKAADYLKQSAYPDGFTFDVYATESGKATAELLQAMVQQADIGISMNIVQIQDGDLFNYQYGLNLDADGHRPYAAYVNGWVSDYLDPVGYLKTLFHSANKAPGAANQAMWSDEEFDKLIDHSYTTTDDKERLDDFLAAAKIEAEACAYVPLEAVNDIYVLNDKYTFEPSPQAFWNFSFRDFSLAK